MRKLTWLSLVTLLLLAVAPTQLFAGAVITSGSVSLGIFSEGHLGFGSVGVSLAGVGDAIILGCLCEGWGVSGSGASGWANAAYGGASGLTLVSFSSTANTATSTVNLTTLPALQVTHAWGPAPGAPGVLFRGDVTISNLGSSAITDVRYRRVFDWDVPPTLFYEFVTIGGWPATNLLYSSNNGFASANPLVPAFVLPSPTCPVSTNFIDCGPGDHGGLFDFGFGDLAPGSSVTFRIYYGAATSEVLAFAALAAESAEVYSFGQPSSDPLGGTPGTFIFAAGGVGGTPIPEPATLALVGGGLAAFAAWKRAGRKRA